MVYQRIRNLREDRDLKQREIAEYLNCSQRVYSNYELGQRDIPTDVFFKAAARLDELAYQTCFRKGKNTLTAKIQEAQDRMPESQTFNYRNIDHGR